MNCWLIDVYRNRNCLILWMKTPEENVRIEKEFRTFVYLEAVPLAERFLKQQNLPCIRVQAKTYLRKWKTVFAVPVPNLSDFERFVRWIERETQYKVPMYNADILPEQMWLYEHDLKPCTGVRIEEDAILPLPEQSSIALSKMELEVIACGDIRANREIPVKSLIVNGKRLEGEEKSVLARFAREFALQDPDVIVVEYGFSMLPYLAARLEWHGIDCSFHRWDPVPILYKGGKSYYTYGSIRYQNFAVRLHGRFLVDSSTMVGATCEIDAILELCQLSGCCFQQLASRSFGAVFQSALVREMVRQNFLVPFKEKPINKPLSLAEFLKSDRTSHTFDPKPGFHTDVAEIDFCSMFPWLIYNHNISADTLLCEEGPFETVPGTPIRASLHHKGLVPIAIKPFIDRRMEYKRNPTAVNKQRAVGLKWVLVTSYGYLRFREFKLGLASSYMAIGSFARETLIAAAHLAEEKGFEVVHGIVDSLYIKRKGITEREVREFCEELGMMCGIPVSFEGIFRWIVFLPSILDKDRPLPCRYYGVFSSGDIKARGIEVRQRSSPLIVKSFQLKCLERIHRCSTEEEIRQKAPGLCRLLKTTLRELPNCSAEALSCSVRIARPDYKTNIPQKKALDLLRKKGISLFPGQLVKFVFQSSGVALPEDYNAKPDIAYYKKLLIRSLYILLQPFGFAKEEIEELTDYDRQTRIKEYTGAQTFGPDTLADASYRECRASRIIS